MNSYDIDFIIERLNTYLIPKYIRPEGEMVVLQADYDGERLVEPYAEVQRGLEDKASYIRSRQTRESTETGINLTYHRNDDFEIQFQSYGSVEDSKRLSNDIYDWFVYVGQNASDITVKDITEVSASEITIAKETIKTFLFTVTLGIVVEFTTTEQKVEGVIFNVDKR